MATPPIVKPGSGTQSCTCSSDSKRSTAAFVGPCSIASARPPIPYIAEPVGRACLLLPGTEDELRRAAALIDRAVAAKGSTPDWIYRFFLFAKGLAEYRQGRLGQRDLPDARGGVQGDVARAPP